MAIFPEHRAKEFLLHHIFSFVSDRLRVVITKQEISLFVNKIRHLGHSIPFPDVLSGIFVRGEYLTHLVIFHVIVIRSSAMAIERHSQHLPVKRNSPGKMQGD